MNFSSTPRHNNDFTLGTPQGPVAYDDFGYSAHGKVHHLLAPNTAAKRTAHARPLRTLGLPSPMKTFGGVNKPNFAGTNFEKLSHRKQS